MLLIIELNRIFVQDSVTLEEINSAEGFVQNLEKIELPNQLVAVLDDPLLQKLLLLRPGDDSQRRVNNWIADCVQEGAHQDPSVLAAMLEPIHRYVTQTKVCHAPDAGISETNSVRPSIRSLPNTFSDF